VRQGKLVGGKGKKKAEAMKPNDETLSRELQGGMVKKGLLREKRTTPLKLERGGRRPGE